MNRTNVYHPIADTDTESAQVLAGWFDLDTTTEFSEGKRWNGNNHVGVISGGQIGYQRLHRTKGGRWVLESDFRSEFNGPHTYDFLSADEAKIWLIRSEINDDAVEKYFGAFADEHGPGRRTVGQAYDRGPGRPEIGPTCSLRFPARMLERVDECAQAVGVSRAEMIRRMVARSLDTWMVVEVAPADPGAWGE